MNIDETLIALSLVIDTVAVGYLVLAHRDDFLIEVRMYQMAMVSIVLSLYLQAFVAFSVDPNIETTGLLIFRFVFLLNSIGVLFLFLMLYIPQLGFNYMQVGFFILSTAVFVMAAVTNAITIELAIVNGEVVPVLTPVGLLFNSLSVVFLLVTIWVRFREIIHQLDLRGRSGEMVKEFRILSLLLVVAVLVLILENTIGLISVQSVNVLFSFILLFFVHIIAKFKHNIFLTAARLEGVAILQKEGLDLVIGKNRSDDTYMVSEKFLKGPFSAVYESLNDSILSIDSLESISFGSIKLVLYSTRSHVVVFSITESNLIVDRLLSKFSNQLSDAIGSDKNKDLLAFDTEYDKLTRYF